MPRGNEILIFVGVAVVMALFAWIGYIQAKRRREAIARLAHEIGLKFDPSRDYATTRNRYGQIDFLGRGKNRYSYNNLSGTVKDCHIFCCDYHYETESRDSKGRKTTHHHYYGVVFVEVPLRMSEVRIRREGWFDKIAGAIGFDDIDFESAEFSRRFHVAARERKFAYDLIHPRAMEYLMSTDKYSWEFEGGTIALFKMGCFDVDEIRQAIDTAVNFVEYIPPHVWADRGRSPASA